MQTACKAVAIASKSEFTIRSSDGTPLLEINELGRVTLFEGSIYTYCATAQLAPTSNSEFVVKTSDGTVVARLDGVSGDLFLKGNIIHSDNIVDSPTASALQFVNVKGSIEAAIGEAGNLYYEGTLVQQ